MNDHFSQSSLFCILHNDKYFTMFLLGDRVKYVGPSQPTEVPMCPRYVPTHSR